MKIDINESHSKISPSKFTIFSGALLTICLSLVLLFLVGNSTKNTTPEKEQKTKEQVLISSDQNTVNEDGIEEVETPNNAKRYSDLEAVMQTLKRETEQE